MQKIRKQHQKIPVSFCLFQVLSLVKSWATRCSEHEKKSPNCIFLSTLHDTPRLHESWIMTQTLPEGILDFILIWLICSWNYKSQQEIPNFRLIPKRPRVDVFGLSLLKWSCSPTNFLMRPPKWPLSIFLSTGADRTIMEKRLICETAYWCWDYMEYF